MPDGSTLIYIVCFLLLFLLSAYFSSSEMALTSVNKIHMMSAADNGNKRAKKVLYILDNFEKALTTLLVGNNIVNISAATLATVVVTSIAKNSNISSATAVTLSTVVITIALFLFSEMLPKSFAKSCNEKFALTVASSIIFLMKLLSPVTAALTALTGKISKKFLKGKPQEPTVTEDEFQDIVENITDDKNEFDEDTAELVKSAFRFSEITVMERMVPLSEVFTISVRLKSSEIYEEIKNCSHSRIPVIGRGGEIKGILNIRNFLKTYLKSKNNVVLAGVIDRPFYVSAEKTADEALAHLSSHKRNLAIVLDDSKKPIGIVTVEDLLETLVGKIYDEEDGEVQENVD